jgi:hypothetical protein
MKMVNESEENNNFFSLQVIAPEQCGSKTAHPARPR